MRLKQFFQRLPKDGWYLDGRAIRRRHSVDLFGGRRFTCVTCPVSQAANHGIELWRNAAHCLGLSIGTAWHIVHAADCEWHMTPTERRIRRLLLAHCGLVEVGQ